MNIVGQEIDSLYNSGQQINCKINVAYCKHTHFATIDFINNFNFSILSTDNKSLEFTCLFHTYFRVADISSTAVSGLKGVEFSDSVSYGIM